MEVTLFGFIWLALLFVAMFRPISWMVSLLIISGVFQATAVINLPDKGFTPFIFTQIFFILRCFVSIFDMNEKPVLPDKGFVFLVIFFLFASIGAFALPIAFQGIKVYTPDKGIDLNYLIGGSKLKFTSGNIIQCIYLLLNIVCIYQLYKIRSKEIFKTGTIAFITSIIIVLIIGFWEFSSKQYGLVYYPTSFFSNNAGYELLNDLKYAKGIAKLNSSFIEPSFAGGFIAAAFWAVVFIDKIWAKILALFLFLALCFNLSGTGFATFIGGGLICLFVFNRRYFLMFFILFVVLYYIVSFIGYGDFILNTLLNKSTSGSGISRQGSNDFSLKIFLETSGLGVGLGSHRASSFLYTLIGTSGILILFLLLYLYKLFKAISNEVNLIKDDKEQSNAYAMIFRFGIVYFIAQCLAIPDISNPTFWSWQYVAFLGVYMVEQQEQE